MNHNFDPRELERAGNQSIKHQQATQAVSLTLLRLTLRSNEDTEPSIRMHRYRRMKINSQFQNTLYK